MRLDEGRSAQFCYTECTNLLQRLVLGAVHARRVPTRGRWTVHRLTSRESPALMTGQKALTKQQPGGCLALLGRLVGKERVSVLVSCPFLHCFSIAEPHSGVHAVERSGAELERSGAEWSG